jgi:[ribosomal protein S5]-alanine N-acetyltransferase
VSSNYLFDSPRLRFRETTVNDAEVMYRLNSDPEVMQYTGDVSWNSVEEARKFLANYPDFRKNNMGRWAAVRKEDDAVIGWCGLKLHPNGEVDLGYRLFKTYWNQGYATEAGLASLNYGFEKLGLKEIIGQVLPVHSASIRVLEKVGMQFLRHDIDEETGEKILVYSISNEDFSRNKSISAGR